MEQSPETLIEQAELALVNEEWERALDSFNQALVLLSPPGQPNDAASVRLAEVQNGRGVALLEMGRLGEAIKTLETALTLKPDMAGTYFNLALAWESLGNIETALHNYDKAIEIEPHDGEAYFRRGGVWFALEQFEKTVEDTGKAIELHQASEEGAATGPYIARGLALHRLERYDEALADYSKALVADPRGAAEAYFYRALVYIDKGEALPARADLQAYLIMTEDAEGLLAQQAREIIAELDKQA